ncbi:MAG: hypothetical protein QOJ39_1660 [Candidatus Eremiobacteraeota bacterium]|jgi:hypothetical protein|nr:hypothetical protein [Candidatus Eremiobacteraeota bacterium]
MKVILCNLESRLRGKPKHLVVEPPGLDALQPLREAFIAVNARAEQRQSLL